MFPKTNRAGFKLSLFLMVLVLLPVRAVLADPRVRIDLERETHKKVVVAVTDFVLDDSVADFMGIGNEAKKILEKD